MVGRVFCGDTVLFLPFAEPLRGPKGWYGVSGVMIPMAACRAVFQSGSPVGLVPRCSLPEVVMTLSNSNQAIDSSPASSQPFAAMGFLAAIGRECEME